MIRDNLFFPLFDERQCTRFLDFLQQARNESRQLSESVVALICCSGRVNGIIGNRNRKLFYRQGDIDCAHQSLTTMYLSTRKKKWNHGGPVLVCPQGTTSKFPRNHNVPPAKHIYGTSYRSQEGDAADGTSFVPFGPCRSTRQFLPSETKHSTINMVIETAPT